MTPNQKKVRAINNAARGLLKATIKFNDALAEPVVGNKYKPSYRVLNKVASNVTTGIWAAERSLGVLQRMVDKEAKHDRR